MSGHEHDAREALANWLCENTDEPMWSATVLAKRLLASPEFDALIAGVREAEAERDEAQMERADLLAEVAALRATVQRVEALIEGADTNWHVRRAASGEQRESDYSEVCCVHADDLRAALNENDEKQGEQ